MSEYNFSISDFVKYKTNNQKITMLTAYDYYSALIAEKAGINTILVGDSLGMVIQGKKNTLSVTVEDIVYHTQAVRKGALKTFVIADMPYLSYHVDIKDSIRNAGELITRGGGDAVKLEINHIEAVKHVEAIIAAQIPVIGHLGLTPQSVNIFGGFKEQGINEQQCQHIINLAKMLEQKGVTAIVLECIPDKLANEITDLLNVPTIGIGSGKHCNGQVTVFHDALGINDKPPRFAKQYTNGQEILINAAKEYIHHVTHEDS